VATILRANPHPGQAEVHRDPSRFKVLAAGRRWGKTRLVVNECLDVAAKGGRAWWVAPSYKMSEVGWRPIRRIGSKLGADVRLVDRMITLPNGGSVTVRSADNPDSLRGEGLDFVGLDEVGVMKEAAWTEALRPALSDRLGRAMFIGTPKGRTWFWRNWQRGQMGEEDWASWQFPTVTNPYIQPSEVEKARKDLPERLYLQEYEAEFIDDAGSVFRGVMRQATATEQTKRIEGHSYIFGVDWGKHQDYTVISVLDATANEIVHLDRFSQIDYTLQLGRLDNMYIRFEPDTIIAERNAMGEPLVELLQRRGYPVQPFTTTNASKAEMVEALALAIERQEIRIIPDPILIGELQAYEAERLPSGMLRYNAPQGMHDDTVIATGLAWHGVAHQPWVIS